MREDARLRALGPYTRLDLAGDTGLHELVSLAAHLCAAPIACVSLIDATHERFLVTVGFDLESTPRDSRFSGEACAHGDLWLVADTAPDRRFADHPLVAGAPGIRAYAGVPLVSADGHPLGVLAVLDTAPHPFTDDQQRLLRVLAAQAMTQLELRRTLHETDQQRRALARATLERRRILDQSVDVLCVHDADGRFVEVSQAAYEVWGRPPEALVGRTWPELIHPDDLPRAQAFVRDVMHGEGRAFHTETRCVHRLGHSVWTRWSSRWSTDDRQAYSVARDVTEQKAAEAVLLEREARLREQAALLEMASDAILTRDLDGRVRFWNTAAAQLFGWTAPEAVGRRVDLLLDDDPVRLDEALRVLHETHAWAGELLRRGKSGEPMTVYSRWTLLKTQAGEPTGVLEINADVTEARHLQAQLLRAQRLESLGTLASGIAHDLNNMLAPIMMAVDVLRDSVDDATGQTMLGSIESSVTRGASLVRQVQAFARGVTAERAAVASGALLDDVARTLADTFPPAIVIDRRITDGAWPILGDATQLQQVLVGLGVNARDAMPDGGRLSLAVENATLDAAFAGPRGVNAGAYVVFTVADTGTGMPPHVRDRIFDPFYTTKALGKGTGLGLSTALGIVNQHGGFIDLKSEPGQGSVFRLHLPAILDAVPAAPAARAPHQPPRGTGELVLVIDDEPSVRDVTRSVLETFGYQAITAGDGAEGVALFAERQHEVAAVITDMMMPVMDGYAAIRAMQRIRPDVRVIAASGLAAGGMQDRAQSAGVTHFLAKPFSAETLLTELDALLREDQRSGMVQK